MELKKFFLSNRNRAFEPVVSIKDKTMGFKASPIKVIKKNWIACLVVSIAVIIVIFSSLRLKYALAAVGLTCLFIAIFIYGNSVEIFCDEKYLNIKQGFVKNRFLYENLRNVYIGRVTTFILFFPVHTYNIIFRFEDNFKFLREFEFSVLCADKEDVIKFVENFETSKTIEERFVKYEKRKFWRGFISGAISFVIVGTLVLYFLKMVS